MVKIQNKIFLDGELIIYTDYKRSEHAGAGGYFQVVDICIDSKSILKDLDIDQGTHYYDMKNVLQDLLLPSDFDAYREKVM